MSGRKPKPPEDRYKTPARQLGRIPDAEWREIQDAVAASGLDSLVSWALPTLLKKARREKKQRAK